MGQSPHPAPAAEPSGSSVGGGATRGSGKARATSCCTWDGAKSSLAAGLSRLLCEGDLPDLSTEDRARRCRRPDEAIRMIEHDNSGATGEAAGGTTSSGWAREAQRQREELLHLRDLLEQLLRALLQAMPRTDVESLLAGCGSSELIQFGREAIAATVVTAVLQRPGDWPSARETIRRGCQRGHARSCDPAPQGEAAALTEQLLDRLDFGLAMHQRRRASLDSALQQARGSAARTQPRCVPRTPERLPPPEARRETR